ncbi:MAG: hypothetical protein ABI129_03145, partial [Rhodanobacter sp.]
MSAESITNSITRDASGLAILEALNVDIEAHDCLTLELSGGEAVRLDDGLGLHAPQLLRPALALEIPKHIEADEQRSDT